MNTKKLLALSLSLGSFSLMFCTGNTLVEHDNKVVKEAVVSDSEVNFFLNVAKTREKDTQRSQSVYVTDEADLKKAIRESLLAAKIEKERAKIEAKTEQRALTFKLHPTYPKNHDYFIEPTERNPDRESFTLSKEMDSYTIAAQGGDQFLVTTGNRSYTVYLASSDTIYLGPTTFAYSVPRGKDKQVTFDSRDGFIFGSTRYEEYKVTPTSENPLRESFVISVSHPYHVIATKEGETFNVTTSQGSYIVEIPRVNFFTARVTLASTDYFASTSDWEFWYN